VTEFSPIVTLNDERDPCPGAIGRPLPSLACLVVDPQTMQPCPPAQAGLLLVSGPSVFGGYLNWQGPSPFAELIGRRWYNTGDLVSADQTGLLRFHGRLKRFAKLGGEMISLPAIEAVLAEAFENRDAPHFPAFIRQIESSAARDEKWGASLFSGEPVFAVVAHPPEGGELVLFSAIDLTREQANAAIRQAGLSPLHQVRRVVRLERLPLLGSGKVDYRALRPD
jgi:long-chain-fatty-acid--[acyl-carrier-protein] ligase